MNHSFFCLTHVVFFTIDEVEKGHVLLQRWLDTRFPCTEQPGILQVGPGGLPSGLRQCAGTGAQRPKPAGGLGLACMLFAKKWAATFPSPHTSEDEATRS